VTTYVLEVQAIELPCEVEITSSGGTQKGRKGDFLVTFPSGEIRIMSKDEFRKTFRPKDGSSLLDLMDRTHPNPWKQPYRITWSTETVPRGLLP
jgi:hypothetical protein